MDARINKEAPYSVVMLIDDNEIDNFINQKMIEGCGFATEILIHTSSRTALDYLRNVDRATDQGKEVPRLIFLDINMPIMDGFQFIEQYSELHAAMKQLEDTKVIMLSTSINPSDIDRAESHPLIDRFINKPLTADHLAQLAAEA